MTALTLQEKLKVGRERKFFSIIDDEGNGVSNKKHLILFGNRGSFLIYLVTLYLPLAVYKSSRLKSTVCVYYMYSTYSSTNK